RLPSWPSSFPGRPSRPLVATLGSRPRPPTDRGVPSTWSSSMINRTLGIAVAFAVLAQPAQTWGAGAGAGRVTFNPWPANEPVSKPPPPLQPPPPPPPPPRPSIAPQNSFTMPTHSGGASQRGH